MSIQRSEIYFVNLNSVQGREQAGQRPVLVLSNNAINQLPLVVIVVVGTKGSNIPRDYPTNVRVAAADSGLPIETVFLAFKSVHSIQADFQLHPREKSQVRYCIRLKKPFGTVSVCNPRSVGKINAAHLIFQMELKCFYPLDSDAT